MHATTLHDTRKTDYLVRELSILAWSASVQRAGLYNRGVKGDSKEVKSFRHDITSYLYEKVLPKYKNLVNETQHYKNIDALIAYGTRVGSGILSTHGYKYGVAQKLLNLVLKYHWCLDLLEEPPHCPVDRIVIGKTKLKGKVNWTQIVDREEYARVITEIRRMADLKDLSIAVWELTCYRRR